MDGVTTAEQPRQPQQQVRSTAPQRPYRGRHRPVDDLGRPSPRPSPRPRTAVPVVVNGRRRWFVTMADAIAANPAAANPVAGGTTAVETITANA